FTRVGRDRDTEESRASGKEVAAAVGGTGRRGTDASRDTLTVPADNTTLPEEEEMEDETSMEEEADFCPLIASSLASVLAPTLASTRTIPKDQRPIIHLPRMSVATKQSKVPDLETVGEQSAEIPLEAAMSEPLVSTRPPQSPDPHSPAPSEAIDLTDLDSPVIFQSEDSPVPVRYPEQLVEVVVVKSGR
ncbi:hypothetical protein PENTCL1PPCAC_27527, partial [Pristionchus entomophagus]